ncbi:unannotated protein [freshwater metagenome]|uniref:Unannotated protein n=1 Tax=freshwater metagenome TaxID=449393 RepID=A0A6J7MU58_9ZZZZ
MKSSTSWFCTSRKYSAMVRAERATRRRTPGGSSIWPKTSAAFSNTPDSSISIRRSVPSRVRSPTPANTDTPPWFWATRRIISVMSTVLPTPAPPNRPILPPATYGVRRSITLMPVSNKRLDGSRVSKSGAGRWISQRSMSSYLAGSSSSTSPHTFHTWPSVRSPTGTRRPWPVLRTSVPRRRPSVGFMHTARTRLSPSCCATSASTEMFVPSRVMVISSALLSSGSDPRGNSTSITGPAMPTTRPVFSWFSVMVMLLCSPGSSNLIVRTYREAGWATASRSTYGTCGFLSPLRASAPLTISMISVVMES